MGLSIPIVPTTYDSSLNPIQWPTLRSPQPWQVPIQRAGVLGCPQTWLLPLISGKRVVNNCAVGLGSWMVDRFYSVIPGLGMEMPRDSVMRADCRLSLVLRRPICRFFKDLSGDHNNYFYSWVDISGVHFDHRTRRNDRVLRRLKTFTKST